MSVKFGVGARSKSLIAEGPLQGLCLPQPGMIEKRETGLSVGDCSGQEPAIRLCFLRNLL